MTEALEVGIGEIGQKAQFADILQRTALPPVLDDIARLSSLSDN